MLYNFCFTSLFNGISSYEIKFIHSHGYAEVLDDKSFNLDFVKLLLLMGRLESYT